MAGVGLLTFAGAAIPTSIGQARRLQLPTSGLKQIGPNLGVPDTLLPDADFASFPTGATNSYSASASGTVSVKLPSGIVADLRGVYGYLPEPETRFRSDLYDFTDFSFVARQRRIRVGYLNDSKSLEAAIQSTESRGASTEEIANRVVIQRNSQKMAARSLMTEQEVAVLESGNLKR